MAGVSTTHHLEDQELLEVCIRCSGGKQGGFNRTILAVCGEEQARLTISRADRHGQEPTVAEYSLDRQVLSELRDAFFRHGMKHWAEEEFANTLVRDRKTTSYRFTFSEHSVQFSSQIYPKQYADPLAELDQIIENYRSSGKLLSLRAGD